MNNALRIYRELTTSGHGRDVEFIANVILTSCAKPTTKLRNLRDMLSDGVEVRCGNVIDMIRIDGDHVGISRLNRR